MATTGPITVKIELPELVHHMLEAFKDITLRCIEAEEAGKDSITLEAIADILEVVIDTVESSEAKGGVPA